MSLECGFFNANVVGESYDRIYNAEQFAAYFASFIGNGVFGGSMQKFQVVQQDTPDMSVKVLTGEAWINGWWCRNKFDITLTIDTADGVLNRIDLVVIRWGQQERDMWLQVIKGTPSANPITPSIVRNGDYYDLQLAKVTVTQGSINISQSKIVDTRLDNTVCGLVTGLIDQIDTTSLFAQFNAYFEEFKNSTETDVYTWFNTLKDNLSEDAAVNLQNQVDDIKTGYWSLLGGTAIPGNANLDNYVEVGNYYSSSNSITNTLSNCPVTNTPFTLKVFYPSGIDIHIGQILKVTSSGREYYRIKAKDGTSFSSWVLLTPGNFVGATTNNAGTFGLVPAPTSNAKDYFLKGDGTWASLGFNRIYVVKGVFDLAMTATVELNIQIPKTAWYLLDIKAALRFVGGRIDVYENPVVSGAIIVEMKKTPSGNVEWIDTLGVITMPVYLPGRRDAVGVSNVTVVKMAQGSYTLTFTNDTNFELDYSYQSKFIFEAIELPISV